MKWDYQGSEIGNRPGTFSQGAVAMQEVQLAKKIAFP